MAKLRRIVLFVVGGLLVAGCAFNAELRGGLLLIFFPQYFREAEFLQFADNTGQEVYLLGTIHSNQSPGNATMRHRRRWLW